MQTLMRHAVLSSLAIALAGCGGGSDETTRDASLQVASNLTVCQTVVEQFCYQTRSTAGTDWTIQYEGIGGLAYVWGNEYTLQVRITEKPGDGTADSSSVVRTYQVLAVTSVSPVPTSSTFDFRVRYPQDSLRFTGGDWYLLDQKLSCAASVCRKLEEAAATATGPVSMTLDHRDSASGSLHVLSVKPAAS